MTAVITKDAWLQALEAAMASRPSGDDGMTRAEIEDELGVPQKRALEMLHALNKMGRLEVGKAVRAGIDGRRGMVPVYRVRAA